MSSLGQAPSILHTERLLLRPPRATDAKAIQSLAQNPKIAEMTATIPYPYPLSAAEEWIEQVNVMRSDHRLAVYLICHRERDEVMGVISLRQLSNSEINLAYWLGEDFWRNGFCTEAGEAILAMTEDLKISPVIAKHLKGNEGSRAVLLRLGFNQTGEEVVDHRGGSEPIVCYRYKDHPSLCLERVHLSFLLDQIIS